MRRTHLLHGLAIGLAGLIVIALLSACGSAPTGTALPTSGLPTAQVLVQHEGDAPILIGQPTAEAAASGPTPAPAAAPGTPIPAVRDGPGSLPYPLTLTKLNFGVVGHLYYTDRAAALTNARAAGFTWFRQQIHWRDIEDQSGQYFWDELDNIVADVNAAGMLLMINITRSPTWYTANGSDGLPQDPAALARFAAPWPSATAGASRPS